MRIILLAVPLAALLVAVGCKSPAATPPTPAAIDNPFLVEMGREDQEHQSGTKLARTDEDRVKLVLAELGAGRVQTSADRFNVSIVLQHSPMTFRGDTLVAISPDNYLLGHHLAKAAFEAGYAPARELVAQSIDRHLSVTTGTQRYGTNRFINQKTEQEELAPIDRTTTDAERATYGVPPLAELLKKYPEAKLTR